ncbi:MAG TPA: hypothetical protein VK589_07170 [Chryseolinea sp.]|nr:hypothetical protein [Chryseolinea sp.]
MTINREANDFFIRYYSEKIWDMIPTIYRHEDGLAENPGVLRSLVEIIATQAAILRRSQDRLWDDQFIELCDDWAVPYIGDLLGTRLLTAQLSRARRIDVAKTIYYRRNNGTPRVLEELISDVSGWDGKLVEAFQRLVRARHGLDAHPARLAGRFTGTLPGGWADLRSTVGSELTGGPFEEYYHLPDMRKPRGLDGRYGISKLNFHLYTLPSYVVNESDPFPLGDGIRFMFDPSGRNIPLFSRTNRPVSISGWEDWHSALEWEVAKPIRCRLLAHAEYMILDEHIVDLETNHGLTTLAAAELRTIIGHTFKSETGLFTMITNFSNAAELTSTAIYLPLLTLTIISGCGKNKLLPGSLSASEGSPLKEIEKEVITAAFLPDPAWSINPSQKLLAIDAEQGRLKYLNGASVPPVCVTYHYGFSGEVGAGTYTRSKVETSQPTLVILPGGGPIGAGEMISTGVVQIEDNRSYSITADHLTIADFTLQVANQRRPYIQLQADWVLSSGAGTNARLILDGLWIASPGNSNFKIFIRGAFECVVIRNCTFDPGGDNNVLGNTIFPVELIIEGSIETFCIERSILGPVSTSAAPDPVGLIEDKVIIKDTIIQSIDNTKAALQINSGFVEMEYVTVLGDLGVHRLYASGVIITGVATVTDNQTGCFRFSAAPTPPVSRLPRPYESFLFTISQDHWFGSRRFGQPAYGQITETAPEPLRQGAENTSEMGAFNHLLNPLKKQGLKTKIEEYMPFGLIPSFINH